MGYVTDNQEPLEAPLAAAEPGYAATSPTTGAQIGASALEYSPTRMLTEEANLGMYAGSSGTAQGVLAAINQDDFGNQLDSTLVPGGIKTPMMSADEINAKYAPMGPDGKPVKITDAPMAEGVAKLVGQAKAREIQRQGVIARYENAHSWPVNFATGTAGFLMDPLNLATAFVPGFGEEATAAALGRSLLARTAGRIVAGATGGAIAQLPLAAVASMTAADEDSDYGLRDALRDTLFSATANALFHAGVGGGLRELGILKPDEIMRQAKAQGIEGVTPKPEAAPVADATNLSADTKYAAMNGAISQLADGREVSVDPILKTSVQAAPIGAAFAKDVTREINGITLTFPDRTYAELWDYGKSLASGGKGSVESRMSLWDRLKDFVEHDPESGVRFKQPTDVDALAKDYFAETSGHQISFDVPSVIDPDLQGDYFRKQIPTAGMTPAQISAQQSALYRDGFDQSLAQPEYTQLDQAIYGQQKPAPLTEADQRLALAQNDLKAFEESGGQIRPEAKAEIDAANAEIAKADDLDGAAAEAAGCLGAAA